MSLRIERQLPSGSDSDYFVQAQVARPLRDARPDISEPLLDIINELLDNSLTHGASEDGTRFRLAQQPDGSIEAIIADSGIGIRAHLARAGVSTSSDAAAIEAAVEPGQTGASPPRGYGLPDAIVALAEIAAANMTIASGIGAGRFSSDGEPEYGELDDTIDGTVATVRVK